MIPFICKDCGEVHHVTTVDPRRYPCPIPAGEPSAYDQALDNGISAVVHWVRKEFVKEFVKEYTLVTATEIDLEEVMSEASGGGTAVQRLAIIETARRTFADGRTSDQPLLHIAWEPLSFKQTFDRAVYPFRTDDFSHDWITVFNREGKPMGGKMPIGVIKAAFNDLGFTLTPDGMKQAVGTVFVTTRTFDEYTRKNADGTPMLDDDGKPVVQRNWFTVPTEVLDNYQVAADRRVINYPTGGRGGSNGTTKAQVTEAQNAALKAALNGKSEDDYFDAVVGTPEINCDPFLGELTDPARLTERLMALGGEVIKGKVYFA